MLFGWIPISAFFFLQFKPHHAVLFTIIGGWLFLPQYVYDVPGLPDYTKTTAISIGLLLGIFVTILIYKTPFKLSVYDIPILIWCFFCPISTSLLNNLGLYDGLSGVIGHITTWGIPYFAGRKFFNNSKELKDLCLGLIIGGLIYLPLCLYEVRMSPRLHRDFYGFYQSSFYVHIRYGGYRPMVFMQMGLMVSLWMALSSVVCFWYYRNNDIKNLKGIPLSIITIGLIITTILCKSANGWAMLALGFSSYIFYTKFNSLSLLKLLLLFIPFYIVTRATSLVSANDFTTLAGHIFDADRIQSLAARLTQEDLITVEAWKRPFLGWGVSELRGMPIDPETGERIRTIRDSLWLITLQSYGFVGLFFLFSSLLLGPWLILHRAKIIIKSGFSYLLTFTISLCLVVICFCIDSLFNGMLSPLYITISGALISFYLSIFNIKQSNPKILNGQTETVYWMKE